MRFRRVKFGTTASLVIAMRLGEGGGRIEAPLAKSLSKCGMRARIYAGLHKLQSLFRISSVRPQKKKYLYSNCQITKFT